MTLLDILNLLLRQFNELVTAATVIVAASLLLYNLTRNQRDRVIRASSALLACLTLTGIADVFVSLAQTGGSVEVWLRIGWIGIALAPAALFHLSDALLATTGLISRGRRRRIVRILYWYAVVFIIAATLTDLIVSDLILRPIPLLSRGSLFFLYVIYFLGATLFAFNNVIRARRRALTATTRRRMSYLLFSLLTPAFGIFPFSLLLPTPQVADPTLVWLLINIGNLAQVLTLAFMAYPLAFFGANKPDRVIKVELLHFLLRGPVIGITVLGVIVSVPRLSIIGFRTDTLTPFFAVATVLFLQWTFTLIMPFLERRLIYTGDRESARQVQELSQHIVTPTDASQLLEAILATICDLLRIPTAFAASIQRANGHGETLLLEQHIGTTPPAELPPLDADRAAPDTVRVWDNYWLYPLFSQRPNRKGESIGVVGLHIDQSSKVQSGGEVATLRPDSKPDLKPDEEALLMTYIARAARVVDDLNIRQEIFASLQDMPTANSTTSALVPEMPGMGYKQQSTPPDDTGIIELIRDALKDYWGGPRLVDDRLLVLDAVKTALPENENNMAKAVRAVLHNAIERLKPAGSRSMVAAEWTLYNILDLRFVQGRKVREVAGQLAMSEPDFYRKQKIAIDRIAQMIARNDRAGSPEPS